MSISIQPPPSPNRTIVGLKPTGTIQVNLLLAGPNRTIVGLKRDRPSAQRHDLHTPTSPRLRKRRAAKRRRKGIALGQGVDRLQQPGRDRPTIAWSIRGGLLDCQPPQDEFAGQSLAVQGGEEAVSLRTEVVGAIGQQDRRFVQVAGEVEQELEAGLIAPVEVLADDTGGAAGPGG